MENPLPSSPTWEAPRRTRRFIRIIVLLFVTSFLIFGLFLARSQGWLTFLG